jgi:hypothetical protein
MGRGLDSLGMRVGQRKEQDKGVNNIMTRERKAWEWDMGEDTVSG